MGHESQCWRGQMAVADDGPSTSILPYPFGTRARGRATLDARHRDRAPRLPQGAANSALSAGRSRGLEAQSVDEDRDHSLALVDVRLSDRST